MSWADEYFELVKKKKKEEEEKETFETSPFSAMGRLSANKKDIAPVVTTKKEDIAPTKERTWFQSGAFEDGYQFGDITKTILGTASDTVENLTTGILGMGEKVVDTLAYVAPYIAQGQYYQNGGGFNIQADTMFKQTIDQSKKDTADFIKKDLYDEEKVAKKIISTSLISKAGIDGEKDSVFGEKTDSLVQSGGQLLATAGLQAVGVPWFVTSGATSFGSEVESALGQGASMEEAGLSSAITAGAEIITEKISGGIKFGKMGTLDDALTKRFARSISNKFFRTGAKLVSDAVGEGSEEVLSDAISKFGQWLTYQDEKTLEEMYLSEEAVDEAIESFLGGAVLGGIGGSVQAVKSESKGVDYVTELTKNEQKVVDKVYKDLVAEAEKNGKITEKEKSKIYDDVLDQMEKGYISTDTIEEVLGDKTYKDYKTTVESENSVLKELSEIYEGEELQQQVNDILNNSERYKIQDKLSKEVSELVKGDRLLESYRQRAYRGQKYEADLTQYDAKQQETVKRAMESGVLNNTRRTHELVDIIAKISADKGVLFDFTNNEKLKESGFAVEGKTVNGYVTKDGITLNVQSSKYLNSVVGHEIAHVLEGTEVYDALQETLFEYAKSKKSSDSKFDSEYKERLYNTRLLYKNVDGYQGVEGFNKIKNEVVADLVGDYLFTDSDFIHRLSTENRNVFQKIWDEVKYLCKVATAGSKEARELERVKKAFEDAYRAEGKAKGDTKYSVSETPLNQRLSGDDLLNAEDLIADIEDVAEISPNGYVTVYHRTTEENAKKIMESGKMSAKEDGIFFSTQKEGAYSSDYGKGVVELKVPVEKLVLDDIFDAEAHLRIPLKNRNEALDISEYLTGHDAKYSISDSDGKQLSKEQQEYFKDSKMRDENGNLKVMYHGSQDAGFHTFDSKFSDDDTSFFFVDRNDVATTYSGTSEVYEAKAFRSAEDANKFFAEIGKEEYEVVEKDGKYTLLDDGDEVATSESLSEIYDEWRDWEGVGYGDANYKVYLNLKNPLEVDAKGRPWNKIDAEFSQEVYDRFQSLTAEEKDALRDLAEWEDFSLFNREIQEARDNELASAYEKLGDVNIYDLFSVAADNFSEESLRENSRYYLKTRDYAQRAKEQGYDGVIFKNIIDNGGYSSGDEGASTVAIAFESNQIKSVANEKPTKDADIRYSVSEEQNQNGLNGEQEVAYSISNDTKYADSAIAFNQKTKYVSDEVMQAQKLMRERVANRLREMVESGVALPQDKEGDTFFPNKSYGGTEENTLICPRSLAPEAFMDAVSEYIGRPLTVEEQIYVGQDLISRMGSSEELRGQSFLAQCVYCYVAADRMAQREFLGEYIKQRDSFLQKVKDGIDVTQLSKDHRALAAWFKDKTQPAPELSEIGELYKEFLNGRKPTGATLKRVKSWVDAYKNGKPMIDGNHLANIDKLVGDLSGFDKELIPQIKDAWKYAQSASWAKKRQSYVAYNGHILKWDQKRVDDLNKHYGLRLYSFSDFHPAFVLENMQMITDASVRGLKMLAYTKDMDFVEIFAPSGININVSTFGFEKDGNIYEDNRMGSEWEKAKALREQHPNVGITFVATNDTMVKWALKQDWIDVVIPYHMVKTGQTIAEHFNYQNYTQESSDKKGEIWRKDKSWSAGHDSSIAPPVHNNDLNTYLAALAENGLEPRFKRFLDDPETRPYYMKLVNECRLSASDSKPVQPVFNEDAINRTLARLASEGYYTPIGGSVERMYEIAGETAEKLTQDLAPVRSLSNVGETSKRYGRYNVSGEEVAYAPVAEKASVAPVAVSKKETTTEMFPDDLAPVVDSEERLASLTDEDAPAEAEAPYYEDAPVAPKDPFENRDFKGVGKRDVNAYMYDNPEVKPYFQMQAKAMLGDLQNSVKGERWYNDDVYYESGGEYGWSGTERQTTDDIAYLLDMGYTYAQIEKGLNAIIEDNGAENIAMAKRIEFALNERLMKGYTDINGVEIPANEEYLNLLAQKEKAEAVEGQIAPHTDADAPVEDIAPVKEQPVTEAHEAIRPKRTPSSEPRMVRADSKGKQRKWVGTSTESEVVDGKVLPKDLDQELIHYQPISNKKTLGNANSKLNSMGYESSVAYMNSQFANNKVTLDDIALGERLIQEAVKKGDTKTAGDLIMDISILGTELGQKVQALSIIKRLTPEGQLRMLQRTVERGKTKGDKAFEGVEITQEMIDHILKTYGKDGTYDQAELNKRVEDVKQKIADQMKVTKMDKVNAWRYLSMLGNPKTHIRNLVSNVAMKGTVAVKNALARTIEDIAPVKNRTKTWKATSEDVKKFAQQTTMEMKDIISGDSKYSESASIKEKRAIFKNKILNGLYEFNSDMLSKEDWWFSKPAFTNSLSEFLTANGITTEADIKKNPKLVEKAKQYALEQSQIATFRQYSWLSNKINEIERKNTATNIAVGSILPFKKTPVNIAKTGLNYSPLGFAKTLTYDISQVKKGNMEASELVDHLAQNVTGSALTLVGYMLASAGFLNGAGDDDKEGKYDYQLGKQGYSINIGDATFSLSWLSPVAMPLFVGANAYEQLVEGKEWNGDVVVETLAQTLDPLSEMSFLSSLDSVLSSYDSGIMKFAGIAETAAKSYIGQFVPTLSSQVASTFDDTKRSTKVAADSDFKFFDETINNLMYKIPGLRNLLEPSTDIWGNEIKQSESFLTRAFESFLAPYARREDIATAVDEEIKDLYSQTGDTGLIPSIPNNYVSYDGEKYEMSAKEYTDFKKMYGQTALDLMEQLFDTETYRNADSETRADMVNRVYDYARDEARKEYFAKQGVEFTNATKEGKEYYKPNAIKGAIENDMPVDEYEFSEEYPAKYSFFKKNGISYDDYASADEDGKRAYTWAYENPGKFVLSKAVAGDVVTYRKYTGDLYDIKADKDSSGKSISGSRKAKVLDYINNMDADYGQKIILFKSEYEADDTYNYDIIDYLNGRSDISYEEMETILKELGFTVSSDGTISW